MDPKGKPLGGFTVFDDVLGGSPPQRQEAVTDDHGRFHFANSGQLLRFEDTKYRPLAMAIDPNGQEVSVQLEDAKRSDWVVPACAESSGNSKLVGFCVRYGIPRSMDSEPANDQENSRSYSIFPVGGQSLLPELSISTNLQGVRDPEDAYRDSSWSEQRWIRDADGNVVRRDMRGRYNGSYRSYWRTASFFGHEYADYAIRSGARAAFLNTIVDSACIGPR